MLKIAKKFAKQSSREGKLNGPTFASPTRTHWTVDDFDLHPSYPPLHVRERFHTLSYPSPKMLILVKSIKPLCLSNMGLHIYK